MKNLSYISLTDRCSFRQGFGSRSVGQASASFHYKRSLTLIFAVIVGAGLSGNLQADPTPNDAIGNTKDSVTVEAPKEGDDISVDLEWSKVSGAEKYKLEIRNADGKVVAERETNQTKTTILLPPGEYQKRLGLINKFDKLYLWTDWHPLRIVRVLQPEVQIAGPVGPIQRGGGRKTIRLKPKGEMDQTRYYLVDAEGKQRSVKVVRDGDEVVIDVDPDTMPPGDYDLVMENPEGKRDVKKDIVRIEPSQAERNEQRRQNWQNMRYSMLVPGIPQRERGQKLKGNALMISFFSSVAFTAYSYQKASAAYNRLESDPLYNIFKDSTTTTALGSQLAANQGVYLAALGSYDRWQADTNTYNRYRIYYYGAAALSAGLYAYHLVDVYRFDIAMTRTAWGDPALSTGLTWTF